MAERYLCDSPLPTNSIGQSNGPPKCMDCLSIDPRNSPQQMSSDDTDGLTPQPAISPMPHELSDNEMEIRLNRFEPCPQLKQVQLVEKLGSRISLPQHERINSILMPMFHRDFITFLTNKGLHHIAYKILSYLDAQSLCRAEQVCAGWYQLITDGMLWKKLISQKVQTDRVWRGLSERRGWGQYLTRQSSSLLVINHQYFRRLYPCIIWDIQSMEDNWRNGHQSLTRIQYRYSHRDVYCLQHDDNKIVAGLGDKTVKIWDRHSMQCTHVLRGHTGLVTCLQYDEKVIITGSTDSTVRVWDVSSGQMLNTLVQHSAAVLCLRFGPTTMVTCSKDWTIAVWDIKSPTDIRRRRLLVGHRGGVTRVDFDDEYIVSGSVDQTIKVWQTSTGEFVRTLHGHREGIACLQYRGNRIISGSFDSTIRIWDVESGACLRLLEGHEDWVTCIWSDDKKIVSGTYYGTIKVWDLEAVLDPKSPTNSLCLKTLPEHTHYLFKVQFDDFQIVSSYHDGIILIWDFLDLAPPHPVDVEISHTSPIRQGQSNPAHQLDSATSSGTATANYPVQETLSENPPSP